ncbi:unannotated protein [freshwater metagenome]|uniref:Unannotated protein n=1 Tax=freshwater metagenome TaxID=449393 RepID=A0A6J6H052_9ZZZZ
MRLLLGNQFRVPMTQSLQTFRNSLLSGKILTGFKRRLVPAAFEGNDRHAELSTFARGLDFTVSGGYFLA